MQTPLMALMTLQLTLISRCLAMTRDMFGLYLSLQPVPVKVKPRSPSRSLVPIENRPLQRLR